MTPNDFAQRRQFLKSATAAAIAGGLPTLDMLTNVALAAAPIGSNEVDSDYKAIVCVFLYGGQDTHNVLIPYQDGNAAGTALGATTVEFDRYAHDRSNFTTANPGGDPATQTAATGNLAYTRAQLTATALPETTVNSLTGTANATAGGWTTNTYGRKFALHPSYSELASIYTGSGKLAVIANVGPLVAPLTRQQWYTGAGARPVNLYSHDDQQKGWMSGTANIANPSIGIAGRLASHPFVAAMNAGAKISTQVSVDGTNIFMLTPTTAPVEAIPYQVGTGSIGRLNPVTTSTGTVAPGTTCDTRSTWINGNPTSVYCVSGGPIAVSNGYSWVSSMNAAFLARMNSVSEGTSVYNDQWRQTMRKSIDTQIAVSQAFINSPPSEEIVAPFQTAAANGLSLSGGSLGAQLRMVAAMIRASVQLGATNASPIKRQIFFVSIGGFDTHGVEFWTNNPNNNSQLSKAINAFWTAMGNITVRNPAVPGETAQNRVTLFTMTDFGRTLDSNGHGSDHGWGSHHFVLGGAVNGGKIYGQNHNVTSAPVTAPIYLQVDNTAGAVPRIGLSPYSGTTRIQNQLNHSLNRGELLPTTASDAVVATIANWFYTSPSATNPMATPSEVNALFPTLGTSHPNGWNMGFMNLA
ncbi:MAG: DUF1501 domain-containing protein [Burkholderiales bacterium]|nr:DUF1501 domain-containing protein [Burkholderiales bacterium]